MEKKKVLVPLRRDSATLALENYDRQRQQHAATHRVVVVEGVLAMCCGFEVTDAS